MVKRMELGSVHVMITKGHAAWCLRECVRAVQSLGIKLQVPAEMRAVALTESWRGG
jgi:hypothetical protein